MRRLSEFLGLLLDKRETGLSLCSGQPACNERSKASRPRPRTFGSGRSADQEAKAATSRVKLQASSFKRVRTSLAELSARLQTSSATAM